MIKCLNASSQWSEFNEGHVHLIPSLPITAPHYTTSYLEPKIHITASENPYWHEGLNITPLLHLWDMERTAFLSLRYKIILEMAGMTNDLFFLHHTNFVHFCQMIRRPGVCRDMHIYLSKNTTAIFAPKPTVKPIFEQREVTHFVSNCHNQPLETFLKWKFRFMLTMKSSRVSQLSCPFTIDAGSVRLAFHGVVLLTHVFSSFIMTVMAFHGVLDISICQRWWTPTVCRLWKCGQWQLRFSWVTLCCMCFIKTGLKATQVDQSAQQFFKSWLKSERGCTTVCWPRQWRCHLPLTSVQIVKQSKFYGGRTSET